MRQRNLGYFGKYKIYEGDKVKIKNTNLSIKNMGIGTYSRDGEEYDGYLITLGINDGHKTYKLKIEVNSDDYRISYEDYVITILDVEPNVDNYISLKVGILASKKDVILMAKGVARKFGFSRVDLKDSKLIFSETKNDYEISLFSNISKDKKVKITFCKYTGGYKGGEKI